jgi:hypothetical protein
VNGVLTQGFLYQGGLRIITELDGQHQVASRFVYADKGHVPAYLIKGGVNYRIIADYLGSPRVIVNTADGTLIKSLRRNKPDGVFIPSVTFGDIPKDRFASLLSSCRVE